MMTAQDLLIEKANNIVEKFKNSDCTNIEEVLNDYNNDISSFENLPEDFLFKRYKSEGHEKFSQMLIDGYERLDSEIKKQFKREFFKNV